MAKKTLPFLLAAVLLLSASCGPLDLADLAQDLNTVLEATTSLEDVAFIHIQDYGFLRPLFSWLTIGILIAVIGFGAGIVRSYAVGENVWEAFWGNHAKWIAFIVLCGGITLMLGLVDKVGKAMWPDDLTGNLIRRALGLTIPIIEETPKLDVGLLALGQVAATIPIILGLHVAGEVLLIVLLPFYVIVGLLKRSLGVLRPWVIAFACWATFGTLWWTGLKFLEGLGGGILTPKPVIFLALTWGLFAILTGIAAFTLLGQIFGAAMAPFRGRGGQLGEVAQWLALLYIALQQGRLPSPPPGWAPAEAPGAPTGAWHMYPRSAGGIGPRKPGLPEPKSPPSGGVGGQPPPSGPSGGGTPKGGLQAGPQGGQSRTSDNTGSGGGVELPPPKEQGIPEQVGLDQQPSSPGHPESAPPQLPEPKDGRDETVDAVKSSDQTETGGEEQVLPRPEETAEDDRDDRTVATEAPPQRVEPAMIGDGLLPPPKAEAATAAREELTTVSPSQATAAPEPDSGQVTYYAREAIEDLQGLPLFSPGEQIFPDTVDDKGISAEGQKIPWRQVRRVDKKRRRV